MGCVSTPLVLLQQLLLSTRARARWVYRYKSVDDQVTCKARLVARGDMQKDIPDDPTPLPAALRL